MDDLGDEIQNDAIQNDAIPYLAALPKVPELIKVFQDLISKLNSLEIQGTDEVKEIPKNLAKYYEKYVSVLDGSYMNLEVIEDSSNFSPMQVTKTYQARL